MIQVSRKPLVDAIDLVERNADRMFAGVELTARGDALVVRGGAPGFQVEVRIDAADVDADACLQVPVTPLRQAMRAMTGDTVTITPSDAEVTFEAGSSRMVLGIIDKPAPSPEFPDAYPLTFPDGAFARAVDATAYAVARAEFQAGMRGLLLDVQGLAASFVGTDGFRLARCIAYPEGDAHQARVVLPLRAATEIARACSGTLELALGEERITVRAGGTRIQVTLEEAAFPDYQRVIPGQFSTTLSVDADALGNVVKRVAILADQSSNKRIDLSIKNGTMRLSSAGPYGSSVEEIALDEHAGDDTLELAVNATYLVQALAQVNGACKLRLNQGFGPFLITPADDSVTGLVVPLRT